MFQVLSEWTTWLYLALAFAAGIKFTQLIRNKIPILDYGHRCFGVRDESTVKLLLCLLRRFGLRENFTFSPGPTHQTVLNDGTTVLMYFDEEWKTKLPPNGFSVVSRNPKKDALWFAQELAIRNHQVKIHTLFPEARGKVVVLESSAFAGWVMVFRLHSLRMGERPGLTKIDPNINGFAD